ncbi:MAG: ABC transporter permease [Gemmatimonadales bacterium]
MSVLEIFRVAIEAIRATKLRSLLTTLGIVIGVAAVITMVALGSGAQAAVNEQLEALGTDLLSISAGQSYWRGVARAERVNLTTDDAHALERDATRLSAVVPAIQNDLQVKLGNQNVNVEVSATTAAFVDVHRLPVRLGRSFTAGEDQARRRVAVVGEEVPDDLEIPPEELVGQSISIRGIPFEVIGVLDRKGDQPGREDPDETIYIPFRTGEFRIFGSDRVSGITVQLANPDSMEAAVLEIEGILRREHRLRPDQENDFRIRDRSTFLTARAEASATLTYLLAGIATVSLIVGGIGIMNIMLVSVTERTREIGVRKALGATRRQVLFQFLLEALTLCLVGGAAGIALGVGAAATLSSLNGWNTAVPPEAIGLAVLFSVVVGLFFGVWPARRAARLDPIEALRYE